MSNGQDKFGTYPDNSGVPLPPTSEAATSALGSYTQIAQNYSKQLGTDAGLKGPAMVPAIKMPEPRMPLPPVMTSPQGAIPQGPFGSVGERKRADRQAALTSVANLIQTAQKRAYEKKVDTLKHDYETLKDAIDEYNQGTASGNRDMIQHGSKVINEMVGPGSKKLKELSKAFDVNLNPMAQDGGKGKKDKPNPSFDAINKANLNEDQKRFASNMQNFQQGRDPLNPQAHELLRRFPSTFQPSAEYAQTAKMIQDKLLPTADARVTASSRVLDAALRAGGQVDAASLHVTASEILRSAAMATARMHELGQLAKENMRYQNEMNEIWYKASLASKMPDFGKQMTGLKNAMEGIDALIGSPDKNTGLYGQIAKTNSDMESLQGQLSKYFRTNQLIVNMGPNGYMQKLDEITSSNWPLALYGASAKDIEILNQIKALQKDLNDPLTGLNDQLKAATLAKEDIASRIAAASKLGGGNASTDSNIFDDGPPYPSRITGGDDQDGGNNPATDIINKGADDLQRSFGTTGETTSNQ